MMYWIVSKVPTPENFSSKSFTNTLYWVFGRDEEADGAVTRSTESTPSGQGEPLRGGTDKRCIHIYLLVVMQ